ncbi:hypothetical protein X777_16919 [Ooceraea biroi]|uniref:Uncharacterized protein n=1 Tax=Ooceraea biroi TaxID=2015173 RepID=A0A026WSD6_OOCBI|nr:hypothetical protein X777_16919 [Ooceraea biroi]
MTEKRYLESLNKVDGDGDDDDDDVCTYVIEDDRRRDKILTAGQDKPRTVVQGELTSRRVFCRSRPQADWELRKP